MNIGFKEDIISEFKSDKSKLSDSDIVDAVVAFANTNGGALYIGVEDDGEITGLHDEHKDITKLAAFIANKTVPPISTRPEIIDNTYIKISIPSSKSIVASSSGKILRRRIKADGTPENVPMYPHEINTRLSTLSLLDYSALRIPNAEYDDLDDLERKRLRTIIKNYHGESLLLELENEELDKALRLAVEEDGKLFPTYCGLLLIGKIERIKEYMPTAESAFQVLHGTSVVMNESFIIPLLSAFEKIETFINAHNTEVELEEGFFRISLPDFNKRAIREALVNAFCHRDYTMLGRVRVLIDDDGLTIANPGGFIEGVTIDNLLSVEPHGRNPALADALKRIGLAERTGRGVDRIYEGSLLYGKPLPDYSESTDVMVKLFIPRSLPDKSFISMISDEQKRTSSSLPINSLLVLNELKRNRRADIHELAYATHVTESKTKITVEKLVETGLIEANGNGKNRFYTLSAKLYKQSDNVQGYVLQKGIDSIRYPEMIIQFAENNNGKITRSDVIQLLKITDSQAYRILKKLADSNKLELIGKGKYSHYKLISK